MPDFSTADCKAFLATNWSLDSKGWKRVSKSKDHSGRTIRWFEHKTGLRVAVVETSTGLVDITHEFSSFPMSTAPGPWDYHRKVFTPEELSVAKLLVDAVDQTNRLQGLRPSFCGHRATPGLFSFSFFDPAGERETTIDDILANPDPDAIVAGVGVFFALRHRDYGCNHLSWALKAFLPDYFEEVEESLFAMDEEWHMASSSEYRDAVNDGSIRQVKLMDIVRDLSARGFHYHPKICVFKDILSRGRDLGEPSA